MGNAAWFHLAERIDKARHSQYRKRRHRAAKSAGTGP
jgi:hypothetical protein